MELFLLAGRVDQATPRARTGAVRAESLCEAEAQALGILRGDIWVEEIGEGLTELKVRVKQPAVEHRVAMHMIRKGQVRWLAMGDISEQVRFILFLFGLTA